MFELAVLRKRGGQLLHCLRMFLVHLDTFLQQDHHTLGGGGGEMGEEGRREEKGEGRREGRWERKEGERRREREGEGRGGEREGEWAQVTLYARQTCERQGEENVGEAVPL